MIKLFCLSLFRKMIFFWNLLWKDILNSLWIRYIIVLILSLNHHCSHLLPFHCYLMNFHYLIIHHLINYEATRSYTHVILTIKIRLSSKTLLIPKSTRWLIYNRSSLYCPWLWKCLHQSILCTYLYLHFPYYLHQCSH